MNSQEVIALVKNKELKEVMSYVVDQCNGLVVLSTDGRDIGCLSDVYVYSECFNLKQLTTLFSFAYHYEEVVFSKQYQMMKVLLEIPLEDPIPAPIPLLKAELVFSSPKLNGDMANEFNDSFGGYPFSYDSEQFDSNGRRRF